MERFARRLWRRWRHQVWAALNLTSVALILDALTDTGLPVEPRGDHELDGKAAPTALYALGPG